MTRTRFKIARQNIQYETDRAYLIKMPQDSEYNGYCYWYPFKLAKTEKETNSIIIKFKDNFIIRLVQYGCGKEIKAHQFIGLEEMRKAYENG